MKKGGSIQLPSPISVICVIMFSSSDAQRSYTRIFPKKSRLCNKLRMCNCRRLCFAKIQNRLTALYRDVDTAVVVCNRTIFAFSTCILGQGPDTYTIWTLYLGKQVVLTDLSADVMRLCTNTYNSVRQPSTADRLHSR